MLPLTPTGGLEPPRLGSAGGKRSDWFALGVTESSSEFSNALPEPEGKTRDKKHLRISEKSHVVWEVKSGWKKF